jgi:hypothetical protein
VLALLAISVKWSVKTVAESFKIFDTLTTCVLSYNFGDLVSMKKAIILGLASIALNTFAAVASADEQYPAANFEPSVIYIDEKAAAATQVDEKYPAANFQPTVIFTDEAAAQQSSAAAEQAQEDPNYPAAYFKPKVIYP